MGEDIENMIKKLPKTMQDAVVGLLGVDAAIEDNRFFTYLITQKRKLTDSLFPYQLLLFLVLVPCHLLFVTTTLLTAL